MKNKQQQKVSHVVEGRCISWKNGEFFVWNVPGMILPLHTYLNLIENFKQQGTDCDTVLYSIGEKQAIFAADHPRKQIDKDKKHNFSFKVIEQIALLGFGKTESICMSLQEGRATFKNTKNPFARHYKKLYGLQPHPVDAYICGVIAGVLEVVTNRDLGCVETSCIAKGDPDCVFEVMPKKSALERFTSKNHCSRTTLIEVREIVKKQNPLLVSSGWL